MCLVAFAGILFAIARWRRHPGVSLVTVLALLLYLIRMLCFSALDYLLPTFREPMHLSYSAIENLYTVLGVLNDIVFAIVLLMLVVAAFSKRRPAAPAI